MAHRNLIICIGENDLPSSQTRGTCFFSKQIWM